MTDRNPAVRASSLPSGLVPRGSRLEGLLSLDKPLAITSAKALYRVRAILGQRKSGHAGTLDPAASGVLLICLGAATKLVERLMDLAKVYRATARLDVTSESYDADGVLTPVEVDKVPGLQQVRTFLAAFEGVTQQIPPRISAVKVGGVAAYKRHRSGQEVALAPRPVVIHWIHLRGYEWPVVEFDVCCGRGMYVRALIRDVGKMLGAGGCLTGLRRLRVGPFSVEGAVTMDQLGAAPNPEGYVVPLERARAMVDSARGQVLPRPD